MDLYETLKSGVSADELLKNFYRDLNEAKTRLAAEKKAFNKEQLEKGRKTLSDAFAAYMEILFGNEVEFSKNDIESFLKQCENKFGKNKFPDELNIALKRIKDKDGTTAIEMSLELCEDESASIINKFLKNFD